LQDIAVAAKVVGAARDAANGIPPPRKSEIALIERGRANASGSTRRALVGRTRTAIPTAAPEAAAQRRRRRALTAQRTAASAQNVATASLVGWIAW